MIREFQRDLLTTHRFPVCMIICQILKLVKAFLDQFKGAGKQGAR